jgi:superfamily II DNA or RNA helicase
MTELFFTIDQVKGELLVRTELSGQKRQLYRDTLLSSARGKEADAVAFLIREKLRRQGLTPLSSAAETLPFNEVLIPAAKSNEAIKLLALSGKLQWRGKKLLFDPFASFTFYYELSALKEGQLQVEGKWQLAGRSVPLCDFAFPGSPPWFVVEGVIVQLQGAIEWKWIEMVLAGPQLLEGRKKEQFCERFDEEGFDGGPKAVWKTPLPESSEQQILPFLKLKDRSGAFADLWMDYGQQGVVAQHDPLVPSWRKLGAEKAWEKDLLETDYIKKCVDSSYYYCPMDKVGSSLTFLLEIGWKIFDHLGRRIVREKTSVLSLSCQGQQILLKGRIAYEEHEADLADVVGAFNRRERFIDLSEGVVGLIDEVRIEHELGSLPLSEIVAGAVAFQKREFGLLRPLLERADVPRDPEVEMLTGKQMTSQMPSPLFQGELHPYQQEGLNWLLFLKERGFQGILADEMGLGKTVQLLALFSKLERSAPTLIVVPTSLLFNWQREIERFLPSLPLFVHAGKSRFTKSEELQAQKLILTSYSLLRQDLSLFQSLDYECLVLDEAQLIKNPDSQTARAAFSLKGALRLAVTGTPVENRSDDLWSLFAFLMPGLLGERSEFRAKVQAAESDGRYQTQIRKKIAPFILRRKKEEILLQLPPKLNQLVWVEMEEKQRALYEEWVKKNQLGLLQKIKQDGSAAHRMEILEAILRLRQICCHPGLVCEEEVSSAKLERLMVDLDELVAAGRKGLVYSQFTQMLGLIEEEVKKRGWSYVYLDGSTKDREAVVKQFQEEANCSLFLISLKAGGVGLNLTAADTVFLYDPWWNEAVEEQAIDRAHRIGQKGQVIARRYLTAFSIEEKIMKLKEHKRALSKGLLDFEVDPSHLTDDDLCDLLT